jgi:hypothetical protein
VPTYRRRISLSAQVRVKLTPDLRSAIERAAASEDKSLSDWVRDLIIAAIGFRFRRRVYADVQAQSWRKARDVSSGKAKAGRR